MKLPFCLYLSLWTPFGVVKYRVLFDRLGGVGGKVILGICRGYDYAICCNPNSLYSGLIITPSLECKHTVESHKILVDLLIVCAS